MLCYYVTGHGFGHAVRTTQVLRALAPDLPLIVKTTAPERLLREELPRRAFTYVAAEYDCGCVQSDSVSVLEAETLARYGAIAEQNAAGLGGEVAFLRGHGVRCVATDIAAFPLQAARAANIPGVAVCNFTWHDIYAEYVRSPQDAALLAEMAAQYAQATVALVTPLHVPTVGDVFPTVEHIPLVARRGTNIRAGLTEAMGIPAGKHLALLYLGGWGMDIDWPRLERWTDWVFLVDRPLPRPVANTRAFDPAALRYADVAASVDAVVSKAGYGTLTECIADGVPLVYLPRHGFAEHDALVLGMTRWAGGVEISEASFFAGDWGGALDRALAARPDSRAFDTEGAQAVARVLEGYCR
jgi:hypothetical protein